MTTADGSQPVARPGFFPHLSRYFSPLFVPVVLAAFVLVAGACGDSDEGSAADEPPAGAGVSGDGADQDTESGDQTTETGAGSESETAGSVAADGAEETVAEPETIEQLEASWRAARTEVVDSIRQAGYGVGADNILRGPDGFQVDLNDCPAGWDDRAGTDGAVRIAQTSPQTGELWAYGLIADGLGIYFDYVNRDGGIDGQQLELLVLDDGYDRSRTVEVVEDLVAAEQPFAITTFGGPTSFAVTEQLNDECIPQPFVISNHPAWGNPANRPWTTGMQLSYSTEAMLWGTWIEQNLEDRLPVTVAALVVDSAFGSIYEESFSRWAEQNPDVIAEFVPVRHAERTQSVSAEMQQIAAADPDVFIAMTNESPCLLAVVAAGEVGLVGADTELFTSSVCRNAGLYMAPAGSAADGFRTLGGGWKVPNDPAHADDLFMGWVNTTLAEAQADTAIGFFGSGFAYYGWAYVEALRIAAELDGGLTRSNLLLAQRAMTLEHPALLSGIEFSMSGSGDGYFVEGSNVDVFDAELGAWKPAGPVLDLNGLTPSCSWDGSTCS
ncbi:MAG: ABC transporter substrate-binding protein [Acidimicrobiales bacterium]